MGGFKYKIDNIFSSQYTISVRVWFEIFSEFFVNLSVAWFALVIVEPQVSSINSLSELFLLTYRVILGILSLVLAKYFREQSRKRRK